MSKSKAENFIFKSGHIAKNKFVLAPLTNLQGPGGVLSREEYNWLRLRVEGGFGVVTTCATHVMPSAQARDGQMGTYDKSHIPGLQKLAKLGRENDCLILPQIFHGGFRCPSLLTGVQPVSASEFIIEAPNFEKPRALKSDEIENIKSQFVKSAKMVVDQGLPGIELHGANGYLFTQFLSSQTNTRTDQWGGSLENRSRFLLETARDIRKQIGTDKILGVRISPENTKLIHGITIEDMAVVCGELSKLGVDYISLSLWDAVKRPDQHVGKDLRDSTVVEYFRKVIPSDVAIFVSGKIWTHIEAQKAFDLGADFVALGASGIANPRWPVEVWQNKQAPYRFPMTESQMSEIGVSPRFRKYLERWNYVK